jgi:hypothetical protein
MPGLAGLYTSHQPAEHFPQILLGNRGHPVAQIFLRVWKGQGCRPALPPAEIFVKSVLKSELVLKLTEPVIKYIK